MEKRKKKKDRKQQRLQRNREHHQNANSTSNIMAINSNLPVLTQNVNGLNAPIERQWVRKEWVRKEDPSKLFTRDPL